MLGASEALGEFLIRHPEHLDAFDVAASPEPRAADAAELRARLLQSVQADPKSRRPVAGAVRPGRLRGAADRLPARAWWSWPSRTCAPPIPLDFMPAAGAELADLAGAAIEAALAVSRAEAAEQFARAEVADVGLAVIGMGKCGARELNYISDVDVIYVIEAGELDDARANTIGTALASGISRAIMSIGREPGLWEVDANLRPEGKSGPLVRTLASHQSYYARWAESWEFQALLKARTIAGDAELGARYEAAVAPLIWSSAGPGRLRGIRPGHAPPRHRTTFPPTRNSGRSSWAAAACGTSNSPSSCCSWCTASPTNPCAAGTPPRPSPRSPPAATSAGRTPPNSTTPTATCGSSSTGSSSSSCAARTSCRSGTSALRALAKAVLGPFSA